MMKKRLVFGLLCGVLVAGVSSIAWASTDYLFVNHCDADISVDFYTHTLLCKDHHSPPFPPGSNWSCSTNCVPSSSVTINYRGVRYPQGGTPTRGTHGIYCTKQPDGTYIITWPNE